MIPDIVVLLRFLLCVLLGGPQGNRACEVRDRNIHISNKRLSRIVKNRMGKLKTGGLKKIDNSWDKLVSKCLV